MALDRGSDKHGARTDDALAAETEAITRAEHSGRAEEWHEAEPVGEDQPQVDLAPDATLTGGTPDGMTPDDVERRSELARYLRPSTFPADAGTLARTARDEQAPGWVLAELDTLRELAADRRFDTVQQIWEALGHGVETHRN